MTPAYETDISWSVLRRIITPWAGDSAELQEVKPLVGGCINTTLGITTKDGQKAVLKICAHRVTRRFAHEAFQLELLRHAGLPVPRVYRWNVGSLDDPFSYLLMEHLNGVNLAHARRCCTEDQFNHLQSHLAELVSRMHQQLGTGYSRVGCDAAPQSNWASFFAELYETMVAEVCKSNQLPVKIRKRLCRIHDRLDRALPNCDVPRLVHWDLWATNLLAAPDDQGKWRISGILDPNCKYAHAEAELAYLELFHTANAAFFKSYQYQHKLPVEYHQVRKPIYQMYALVNHVNLFGAEYAKPLTAAVERVADLV